MLYYNRQIIYIDYMEAGSKVKNAGFLRKEESTGKTIFLKKQTELPYCIFLSDFNRLARCIAGYDFTIGQADYPGIGNEHF